MMLEAILAYYANELKFCLDEMLNGSACLIHFRPLLQALVFRYYTPSDNSIDQLDELLRFLVSCLHLCLSIRAGQLNLAILKSGWYPFRKQMILEGLETVFIKVFCMQQLWTVLLVRVMLKKKIVYKIGEQELTLSCLMKYDYWFNFQ